MVVDLGGDERGERAGREGEVLRERLAAGPSSAPGFHLESGGPPREKRTYILTTSSATSAQKVSIRRLMLESA